VKECETPSGSKEERLRLIEGHLAVYQLLSAYGSVVYSGSFIAVVELWAKYGDKDISGILNYAVRSGITWILKGTLLQSNIYAGIAHLISLPACYDRGKKGRDDRLWPYVHAHTVGLRFIPCAPLAGSMY
jgi:hypothetical protein